jgi:hypothetical protein
MHSLLPRVPAKFLGGDFHAFSEHVSDFFPARYSFDKPEQGFIAEVRFNSPLSVMMPRS